MTATPYLPAEITMQPFQISDPEARRLAAAAGAARDAAYDALQAYADAVYAELVGAARHACGLPLSPSHADLVARGILSEMGAEMAHDWEYGPTAP
ncbi:hypothetical protein [Vulcanococcus sp.]|uniref:hypothetical protein n=1 Tax=Vulcanococcus sp. TaxID=2856995 RepID=UPI003C0186B3